MATKKVTEPRESPEGWGKWRYHSHSFDNFKRVMSEMVDEKKSGISQYIESCNEDGTCASSVVYTEWKDKNRIMITYDGFEIWLNDDGTWQLLGTDGG
jgi:hypothetical protein